MKTIIKMILILLIAYIMYACDTHGEGKKQNIPMVKYCFDFILVNGITIKDTIELYEGTRLEINQHEGSYGLSIVNYYPLYWRGTWQDSDTFIRWGVVNFKINNILPL